MACFVFENKRIHYEEYGQGKPLILLNGIMMSCASWAAFVEPFSESNRLILLDFLDQGRSDRMEGPYEQAIQAEVVKSLLDHLEIKKTYMKKQERQFIQKAQHTYLFLHLVLGDGDMKQKIYN